MKTMLRGTIAALALVAVTGTATAQTHRREYNSGPPFGLQTTITNPNGFTFFEGLAIAVLDGVQAAGVGTRYAIDADAPSDSVTATPSITTTFTLSGSVNKDCSIYLGNSATSRNVNFGVIGVRTGDNENVADAFEMVGPAAAAISSSTAGCNFNNTLTLTKANGVNGMVNAAAGGYDSSQFQANIPYSVQAQFTGVNVNAVGAGSTRTLTVATTDNTEALASGAWRSALNLTINAPVAANALVAGNYSDTLTLTLAAQ